MRYRVCIRRREDGSSAGRLRPVRAGFTLIELIVTMAIIALIAAFSLVTLSDTKTANEVDAEAARVESIIRNVQNLALTGKGVEGSLACNAYIVGVGADAQSVEVTYFDRSTGPCIEVPDRLVYPIGSAVTIAGSGDITFFLPHGIIYYGGTELISGSIAYTVTKGSHSASVCIYPLGRIERVFDTICP